MEKCEEHHHNQPQETPQSKPQSEHVPRPQHTQDANQNKPKQKHDQKGIKVRPKPPQQPQTTTQAKLLDQPLTQHPPIIHQPEAHKGSKPIPIFHTKPQSQPTYQNIPHNKPQSTFPFEPQTTHNPKILLPKIDPYPKFEPTYETISQTEAKPQPTLQSQYQMPIQPMDRLPLDTKLVTDTHLKFQLTFQPLPSHNLIPEQPLQQSIPNLIVQTTQQTQTLQPKFPNDFQPKLTSQTTPSNNIEQPIHPSFQSKPRKPKPPQPLSTSNPISQTQSEEQQPLPTLKPIFQIQQPPQPTQKHIHQTQPWLKPTSKVNLQKTSQQSWKEPHSPSQPIDQIIHHPYQEPEPTLQAKVQTQSYQQSQVSPQHYINSPSIPVLHEQIPPKSVSPVKPKKETKTQPPFQAIPNPQHHTQPHSVPHPKPENKPQPQSNIVSLDKIEPQVKPTAIPTFQNQYQSTSHQQFYNEPYTETQPTYHTKHHPPQSEPMSQPIHQSQPQPIPKVNLQNERYPQSQPVSQFHHLEKTQPTLNYFLETQKESQSTFTNKHQNEPYSQTFPAQSQPILHIQLHVPTTVQDKSKLQQPELELIFPPIFQHVQLNPHKEPDLQPQPPSHPEQPQSYSTSQPTVLNEPHRKAQPEAENQTRKPEPPKTSQHSWNEHHTTPQPTDQVILLAHHQQQFQPTLQPIVQTHSYKQTQPSPQQRQIHSTSISILQKQATGKSVQPVKPNNKPHPRSPPPFQAAPNTQLTQSSTSQPKAQRQHPTRHRSHEPKPTTIPTFQVQSQSTLHIKSYNNPDSESQPLLHTTFHVQQQPQPDSTLEPILQTDPQHRLTSELKPQDKFHSQSPPTPTSISQAQHLISTLSPTKSKSQHTSDNELSPQQTLQDKHQPNYQQYQPKFNLTPQTQSQEILPPVLNIPPQPTPSHESKPVNDPQPQPQQQPQLLATLQPIIQTKPQQTQQATYQTQTPLQPYSQTQHSQDQSSPKPILQTNHSPVFTPLVQTQSMPHIILQTQPQTQPENKLLFQDSTPQPTHHPHPETKQKPLSQPTSQSVHDDKPQQTTQLTNQIPKQQRFQPTNRTTLETQSKSEFKLQKEPKPRAEEIPTHSEPQVPKKPQLPSQHRPRTQQQPKFQSTSTSKPSLQSGQHNLQFTFQNQTYTTLQPKILTTPTLESILQTRPVPVSKHEAENKPKLLPTFNTSQRQGKPTSLSTLQKQSKPTLKPIEQTQSQSQKRIPLTPWIKIKKRKSTTPQPVSQTQTHSTTKIIEPEDKNKVQMTSQPRVYSHETVKSHPILQVQPQLKPTSQPIPESQSYPQPHPRSTPTTKVQTTSQHIPQIHPQVQPTHQPDQQAQSYSQPQAGSTPTTKIQTTSQPMVEKHQSQPDPTPPKLHVQMITTLLDQPQRHTPTKIPSRPIPESQSIPLPHLSSKTQSHPETVLKQHSTSWPQLQPQPGLQPESQTRTYTDPTVTPEQTLFMGKDPTFNLSNPQQTH